MNKINWYKNETDNSSIIAYGDVNDRRVFKIVYEQGKYVCYRFIENIYEKIYEAEKELLPHFQEFCANFDLNTPISEKIKFCIVAEVRGTKQRVKITNPMTYSDANNYKPSSFDKKYYRYFRIALA